MKNLPVTVVQIIRIREIVMAKYRQEARAKMVV